MKFVIAFVFLFFSLSSWAQFGNNRDYCLIDLKKYLIKESKLKLNTSKRYVVVPGLTSKREGIDKLESASGAMTVGVCISLLDYGKSEEVMAFIRSGNMDNETAILVEACRWFTENNYNKALQLLKAYKGPEYKSLAALLAADCCFQIQKCKENAPDWIAVFDAYQYAYDMAEENYQRNLVKHRIKLARYRL